jgi:hypothetical protein
MPERWEQYGIAPAEITASVNAALIGNAVARQCAEDASAALRTLSERATPLTKSSTKAQQAAIAEAVAAIFRNVASQYETRFKALRDPRHRLEGPVIPLASSASSLRAATSSVTGRRLRRW